jgi:peroxiredoxin (alkyl hydroperoxide reductase subunit C)
MTTDSATVTPTLNVGEGAPDFTLPSATTDGSVTLSSFRGQKNVVLAFFPYAFSGTCSAQMPSYEAELDRFRSYDTEVLGISEDSKHSLAAWAKQIGVTFPLLSDFYPQGKVVDLYGVRHPAGMAQRALIVVDKQGKVAWIHIHQPIGEAPNNEELFDVLRRLA